MPGVLLLLPLSLTASEDNWESINKRLLLSQNQCLPHNCCWGRAWKSHSSIVHCLPPRCQLWFYFVVFVSFNLVLLLRPVLVDFINDREPDATVWPCRRVLGLLLNYLFTTSHVTAYRFPCLPPCCTPLSLSRGLGAGATLLGGKWEVWQHIHLLSML